MRSVVVIERTMRAEVEVAHPRDWTDEELDAAVAARLIDINERAAFWMAKTRTVVIEVRRNEEIERDKGEPPRDPVDLVPEDVA